MPPRRRAGAGAGAGAARADKPPTKAQLMKRIADDTGLSKAQVEGVFDSLEAQIKSSLSRHKMFNLSGLIKVRLVHKPATAARMGPKPGSPSEQIMYKAKPARDIVKVTALKGLKDMA